MRATFGFRAPRKTEVFRGALYYYTDFNLVKTNYKSDICFTPAVTGSGGFLISEDARSFLFHSGFNKKGFCNMTLKRGGLCNPRDTAIVYENKKINAAQFSFFGSKAVFQDRNGDYYFFNYGG